MKFFIFDTEGTGLTNKDEVIEFSGILTGDSINDFQDAIDFYAMTSVPIHPKALEVHGIDRKTLYERSGGKYFETQFNDILPKIKDCSFVGYNVSFDTRLVNSTLQHCNLPNFRFPQISKCLYRDRQVTFDVMSACTIAEGRKFNGKLQNQMTNDRVKLFLLDLMHKCGRYQLCYSSSSLPDEDVHKILNELFCVVCRSAGLNAESKFHSSLFDAFCTWILLCTYGSMFFQ